MGDHGLNERQRRFADNVLQGMSQREAYMKAGYKSKGARADSNASNLMRKSKVQAYLAERREKITNEVEISATAVVQAFAARAFWDPATLVTQEIGEPKDIAKLPKPVRLLIKGWKWDQHGNFVLELVDRDQALDKLARILGVYQADAQNWNDKKEDLLNDLFWQWVISHHVHTGKPVPELATYAKAHPDEVKAWGEEVGFIGSGEDAA